MKKTTMGLLGAAALAAVFAAPAAQAATSVQVQIGTPSYYPVYTQPGYVVTGPRYYPAPRAYHRHGPAYRRDADRDGIPNRWDRDRDGDGVANRWDRRPSNPYRY